jgi:lysophospholipase L1-like esterase
VTTPSLIPIRLARACCFCAGLLALTVVAADVVRLGFGQAASIGVAGTGLALVLLACWIRSPLQFRAAVVTLSVLCGLFVAEMALRGYFHLRAPADLLLPDSTDVSRLRFAAHPYLIYYPRPGFRSTEGTSHNSQGYRGPELMDHPSLRIVLHGGSSTYETGVPHDELSWGPQLQAILRRELHDDRIEVVNAGVPGYTSWESLVNLVFRTSALRPNITVLYDNYNDVHAREVDPAAYRSDNTGYRKSWDELEFQKLLAAQESPTLRYSLTARFVYVRLLKYSVAPTFTSLDLLTRARTANHGKGEANVPHNPPIWFERNVRNFVAVSEAMGAVPILMTWTGRGPESQPVAEHNEIIRRIAREHSLPLCDLASSEAIRADSSLWHDPIHMNESGVKKKAETLARTVLLQQTSKHR